MTSPQFTRRAHQVAGGAMTPAQFYVIARLMRMPEPSRTAARRILVDGDPRATVLAESSVSASSLSRTVGRVTCAWRLINDAWQRVG